MRLLPIAIFAGLSLVVACSSDDGGGGGGSGGGATGGSGNGGSGATGSGATGGSGAGGSGAGGSAGSATGGSAGTASSDTWSNYAEGFFATYCVECHGAGSTKRDYTTIDDVIRDQQLISCGVSPTALAGCPSFPPPGQFPIDNATKTNPKPDTAERQRLVQWIQAGLPQ